MLYWCDCLDGYLWAGMLLWASSSWLQEKFWRWKTCQRWEELWVFTPSQSSWVCSSMLSSFCPLSTFWSHAKTPLCLSEVSYRPSSPHWAPPPGEQHTCTPTYTTPTVYACICHIYRRVNMYTCRHLHLHTCTHYSLATVCTTPAH